MPQKKEAEQAKHATVHRAKALPKRTLGERWDDLTEGPFGTIVYIFLGFLIALAVNEGLKPVLVTDTPVVAVFSESMLPTFEKGDMIIVQGGTQINVGDIVVYDAPSYKYPIIHRVISVSEEGITTKGDHNSAADPWVTPASKVHGKAILRIPYLGWVKVGSYELLNLV
jgi:signal peptidase